MPVLPIFPAALRVSARHGSGRRHGARMKFSIEVGTKGGTDAWWEDFDKEEVTDEATARAWAEKTIQRFNDTIQRQNEKPRRFVGGVKLLGGGTKEHRWVKLNLGTKSDHRGIFDMMRCERCKAEGRRYSFGQFGVKRGAPWKAKKWAKCPGAAVDSTAKERK